MKRIIEKIKKARLKKGFSQEKVARECDISNNYYCMLENNKANPSLTLMVKINDLLDLKFFK